MLHYVKSHIYKSYIFFTASINLFYSSFLQSIDRWQFLFFKKYVYIRSSSLSFKHNMPEIPYFKKNLQYIWNVQCSENVWNKSLRTAQRGPLVGWGHGDSSSVRLTRALVHVHSVSPAKYASSSFALIFLSLLFSHESFLIFRGLGHSLVLLLRLRSFPPTTYNVTRLGKTEFLVPFSCLHRQHCRIVQTRQSSRKFLKGINDRDRWESCQSTTEKSNHCYSCHNCQFSNMILRKSSVTRLSWCLK